MTLGERIQAMRKAAGFSQEELGEKLGVARQSVSKWESDTTVPELDKLIAMSKLFGVSVGTLLGLEESTEADRELTDRELQALEAIAQRLTPSREEKPAPAEEPKKRRKWVGVLAVVTVWWAVLVLVGRINKLENQMGNLQYNVSNVQNTVSREIGSISSQVRDILEEQNSVTAWKSYEIASMDLVKGEVTFALTATPREYREGMEAVFSAVGPDFEPVEVQGVLGAGQSFTGTLTCPLSDDITLSVGFVSEGTTVSQQLGQEWYLKSNTQVDVMGNLNWSSSGRGEEARLTALSATVWRGKPGWYKTREEGGQEITVVKGILHLWKGNELFWSSEWEDLSEGRGGDQISIPIEGLELVPGEDLVLSILYTDSAGREQEAFLDGFQVNEERLLDHLAPYVEGWNPWERGKTAGN